MAKTKSQKSGIFIPAGLSAPEIPYEIQKSRRKSWSLSLESDLTLLLKVPLCVSYDQALQLLYTKERWILKKYKELKAARDKAPRSALSDTQRAALEARYRQAARDYIPVRVAHYEKILGVTHTAIRIRDQKTRWGSCSAKGNLNFNWRLMLAPPRVLDYVVVHELCHRKEMNHSPAFWDIVKQVLPDYMEQRKWLRDNGNTLVL